MRLSARLLCLRFAADYRELLDSPPRCIRKLRVGHELADFSQHGAGGGGAAQLELPVGQLVQRFGPLLAGGFGLPADLARDAFGFT